MGAAHGVVVVAHHFPVLAAIVAAKYLAAVGRLPLPRHAVTGLDEGIDAVRIRGGDGDGDLAHRPGRQPVAGQFLPRHPAVTGHEQAAAWPAALAAPGVNLELPHAREEHARVLRIHGDVGAPRVLVDEEHLGPGPTAIGGAEHAAIRLRPIAMALRARHDHVCVLGINDDARDSPGLFEAHQSPSLAGIHRFVDALAD